MYILEFECVVISNAHAVGGFFLTNQKLETVIYTNGGHLDTINYHK